MGDFWFWLERRVEEEHPPNAPPTGAKRRLGFKGLKGLSSLSVQRSEEVLPEEAQRVVRQLTMNSLSDSGNESGSM